MDLTAGVPKGVDPESLEMVTFAQIAFGIVLSRGCEIDKDPKHRLMALVRALKGVPADGAEIIRSNRNVSAFYLPAVDGVMGESYADFRRVTTVHPDLVDTQNKVASLTVDALAKMREQWIDFFTRPE